MTNSSLIISAAILAIQLAEPCWAINKCTDQNGRVSYSDAPCKKGTSTTLNIPKASAPTEETAQPTGQPDEQISAKPAEKLKKKPGFDAAEFERGYQHRRAMDAVNRRIADAEAEIASLEDNRDREINALRNQGRRASNNLAGAVFLQSLAQEQSAVAASYESSINAARDRLRFHLEERRQLENTKP